MVQQAVFKFYLQDTSAYQWAKEHPDCAFIPMSGDVTLLDYLHELKKVTKVPALEILPEKEEDAIFRESTFQWLSDHQIKIWCNSLSLAKRLVYGAGFDDLRSLHFGGDEGWGILIDRGIQIIQTDWPYELKTYLDSRVK